MNPGHRTLFDLSYAYIEQEVINGKRKTVYE